jgi:hypothetical protein
MTLHAPAASAPRIANMPDPTPELIVLTAVLIALRERDARKKPKKGRVTMLDAVAAQVDLLAGAPLSLRPETVALNRAISGAQAIISAVKGAAQ